MPLLFLIVPILLIVLLVAWLNEFAFLINMADSDFPGRYDKILWYVAFLLQPLGAGPRF